MDAKAWDERYAGDDLVWGAEPNRFIRAQCERLPVGQAIDLACGEGRNALWLARLGWRVTGVDYSAVAITRARQLASRESPAVAARLSWHVEDVITMPIRPGAFNLAIVSYLHLPPPQIMEVLLRAARGVAPRGHLVVVGHDLRNLREGVSGPQDESLLYDPRALRELLVGVPELVVELAETVPRHTSEGVALDTLVRARRG